MAYIEEKKEQGYIQSKAVIELAGKPKEHIEETLKKYVERIKKSANIDVLKEEFGEAKEMEGNNPGLWVTFVELEFLAKDIPTLVGFCFDYMPGSIEIIGPKELKLKDSEFTIVMNDLQGKLHKLDMSIKQLNSENKFLQQNAYSLAANLFQVLMKGGANKLDTLAKMSGMGEKNAEEFLKKLIAQRKVKKEEDSYIWIEDGKREE